MTHKPGYINDKDALQKRLRRAEGQIRGIAAMIDKEAYCIDVLTQLAAVRSALNGVAVELVRDHAASCVAGDQNKADELTDAMARFIK